MNIVRSEGNSAHLKVTVQAGLRAHDLCDCSSSNPSYMPAVA